MSITAGTELKVPSIGTALTAASEQWGHAVGLTSAVVLATFADDDGDGTIDIKAQLIDISSLTLTKNAASKIEITSASVTTSDAIGYLVRLSDTVALFVYMIRTVAAPATWEIRATVLTESSGSILQNTTLLQTDVTTTDFLDWRLNRLSDTEAMWVYHISDPGSSGSELIYARQLTVSGSGASATVSESTASSAIYTSPTTISTDPYYMTCDLDSTHIVVAYIEGNDPSGDGFNTAWARVITSNGSSSAPTLGAEAEISAYDANSDVFNDRGFLAGLTSTKVVSLTIPNTSGNTGWQVLTISGTTITIGTAVDEALALNCLADNATGYSADLMLVYDRGTSTANDDLYEYTLIGATVPGYNDTITWTPSNRPVAQHPISGATLPTAVTTAFLSSPAGHMYIRLYQSSVTPTPASNSAWDAAPMHKPCSIDADAGYIYIAALDNSGNPVLIQFNTNLGSDGSIVFQPGSGSDIGVECSQTDPDVIWIGGDFGGTDVIERSTDGSASFVVEDPGTFDPVTAFKVGPDEDTRLIAATETTGSIGLVSIEETTTGGDAWAENNAGLTTPASITALDRLDVNPDEMVLGGVNAAERADYSPNAGADLDDITSGTPTDDVTIVIVGTR